MDVLVVAGQCLPSSRTFQVPMLCQGAEAQEARRHSQDSGPELSQGIFHTIDHHAQYRNWGELIGSHWLLPGDRLGISQWVVGNCIVHHLSVSGFIPLFLLSPFSLRLLYFSLLLNCSYLNHRFNFFWLSSPSHQRRKDWTSSSWYLVASWV